MVAINGIRFDLERIRGLCRRAGVARLYLFGSILTDRFNDSSDIDMLVEVSAHEPLSLLTLGELQMDLTEALGRTVHITLLSGIPAQERGGILACAALLNAA